MKTTKARILNFGDLYRHAMTITIAIGLCNGCSPSTNSQIELTNLGGIQLKAADTSTEKLPKVVVTNTVLCDLTKQIAQNTIDLVCLLSPGIDVRAYKTSPEAQQEINRARLVMYGGYNLEPNLTRSIKSTPNAAPKIAVNEVAVPQPRINRDNGRNTIDPHVWHDAKNGIKVAKTISASLAKVVPSQAAKYRQNTRKLTREISQIDTWMRSQINTIPTQSKAVYITRNALGYYSRAYGIPIDGLQNSSTIEPATPKKAKELTTKIKRSKVPTIFVELSLNPPLFKTIAAEAQVGINAGEIYADGLGEVYSSGGTYQQMLISNTQEIVRGLGGKYEPFN
jgi:manganese/iron transport system substrate-binding protein